MPVSSSHRTTRQQIQQMQVLKRLYRQGQQWAHQPDQVRASHTPPKHLLPKNRDYYVSRWADWLHIYVPFTGFSLTQLVLLSQHHRKAGEMRESTVTIRKIYSHKKKISKSSSTVLTSDNMTQCWGRTGVSHNTVAASHSHCVLTNSVFCWFRHENKRAAIMTTTSSQTNTQSSTRLLPTDSAPTTMLRHRNPVVVIGAFLCHVITVSVQMFSVDNHQFMFSTCLHMYIWSK